MLILTRVELPQGMETVFPRQSDGGVERGAELPTVQPGLLDSKSSAKRTVFAARSGGARRTQTDNRSVAAGCVHFRSEQGVADLCRFVGR